MNGLISLEAYARRKGLPVADVLRSAAIEEVTLCWELVLNETMRPVVEFCPCLSQSEFDEKWEEPIWIPIDPPFPYGQPPSRSGIFRLDTGVNPILTVCFRLLAQGHSPYPNDIDGSIWDSLVIQDVTDDSWWRILGGRSEDFENGRLPLLGELMLETQMTAPEVQPNPPKNKLDQRVDEIRRWLDQQNEFAIGQLFTPQTGRAGARKAAWIYLKDKGMTRPGCIFSGPSRSGANGPSNVFEDAWSQFKAEISTSEKKG